MFKPFFLNRDYELEHTGRWMFRGKMLSVESNTIEIPINGESLSFDRKHICLYTHYRFNPFMVAFDNVEFYELGPNVLGVVSQHIPVFKRPVEVGFGFRVIPGFHKFAITESGNIVSLRTGKLLEPHVNEFGYPCLNVYDPDKEYWRPVAVHILLARAFITNTDPSSKIHVNHIDGNKSNLSLDNLEWVTPQENVTHAIETGLNDPKKSRGCTVHDIKTGEKYNYTSVTKALKAHNITRGYYGRTRQINGVLCSRVYGKRYVITDIGEEPVNIDTYNGMLAARQPNRGPYQALHLGTKTVIEGDTLKEMAKMTGVPYDHVRNIVEAGTPRSSGGYHFRVKSVLEWPTEFTEWVTLKPRKFEARNPDTDEIKEFKSLNEIKSFFSTWNNTIYRKLKTGELLKGWYIREIS